MKRIAKIIGASFGTALLMLSMMPITCSAEGSKSGDFIYEVQGGDVVITRYDGEDEDVLIPATVDGQKVTVIGAKAFQMNADLVSVEVPDGVTKIEDHAFAIDKGLETVTLPATLTDIGDDAFQQCTSLTTVNFAGDESAWSAITIGAENESLTDITPNYNASLTEQEDTSSSEESSAAESSEETSSAEATSSAEETSSTEETSSAEAASSETVSSEAASSAAADTTTTGATDALETTSEEPVPQGSGVNIAYVMGGILVGIAVLDIIYWSVKKPSNTPPAQ